ncbi:hypothetical protein HPP92_015675 [Vanilla planifolia]|uniref:Uncharacterized protein n=1 Tax=Vanilla planifolia TaxID=51239 RepID=A0A835UPS1_VANPL|nr:hypothetical protein HPP92_015675 [Vanilla planifolia]
MLAAAGQNPAAFGVNPAMLATLNPAFAGAFGAGVSQSSVSQAAMAQQGALPLQGYLMGGSGFQNVGFQGSPGFQGPPGFQGTSVSTQGVGGTVTPYQFDVKNVIARLVSSWMALVLYLQRAYRLHSVLQLFGGNDFDLVLATWFWMYGFSVSSFIQTLLWEVCVMKYLVQNFFSLASMWIYEHLSVLIVLLFFLIIVEAKPSELLFNYGFYMNLLQLFKELDLVKGYEPY